MQKQITISVDPDVAEAYRSASAQDRRKLDLLIGLSLREATSGSKTLQEVIAEVGRNARQRGLTPEILQSILDEA